MRLAKLGATKGARATLAYIRRLGLSIPAFAEAHGLSRVRLQNALRGDTAEVSVTFARAIERATAGRVKVAWWAR